MYNITDCKSDADVTAALSKADSTPVIADFYATWCGPCKAIAPTFNDLSLKYPAVKFIKIDVDKCPAAKDKYRIRAMPTFVVIVNGQAMDFIEGGDPGPLHELIKKFATDLTPSVPSPVAGQIDLSAFFNKASAECLNEKDTHTLLQMVDGRNVLESDCDEQLIINIPFNVPVKIHSIEIKGKNGHAPKNVKVFANIISTLDFDRAESSEPTQALDFSQNTLQSLRFVKFQNVNNIQLFIANNTGDDDVTIVESIRFYGQPSGATNMQDFKRVSGKVGEVGH